jgi:hypothetical protein
MGVLNKENFRKLNSKSSTSRTFRSKGNRLGWVSLEDAETVSLENLLSTGKVINQKTRFEHLLVP